MAHRGSPGIHAGRPTPQNLHSASRRAVDQETPRRPTGRPDWRQYVYLSKICFAFAFVMRLFRRRESPSQKAERRCCYGGGAAGRRASRDGPWMARRGVPPYQCRSEGTAEPRRGGRMVGQGLFAYFCGCPSVSGYLSPLLIDSLKRAKVYRNA